MNSLPDLDQLSITEKDGMIREVWSLRALVLKLPEQVAILISKVAELEGRLVLNSHHFRGVLHQTIRRRQPQNYAQSRIGIRNNEFFRVPNFNANKNSHAATGQQG